MFIPPFRIVPIIERTRIFFMNPREQTRGPNKSFLAFLLICGGLAALLAIADRAPLHLDNRHPEFRLEANFYHYYEGILDGSLPGPYAYRILTPFLIRALHGVIPSVTPLTIDAGLKFALLWGIQMAFLALLGASSRPFPAFAGVLWLDVLTGVSLTYVQGPSVAETMDLMNLLLMAIGLIAITRGKTVGPALILSVGLLNRETPLFLLPVVLFLDIRQKKGWVRFASLAAIAIATSVALRAFVEPTSGAWFTFEGLPYNLPLGLSESEPQAAIALVHVALLLGPLLALALLRLREKPLLAQACVLTALLFIIVHFAVGRIIESRLWFPAYLFLLPAALLTLERLWHPGAAGDID